VAPATPWLALPEEGARLERIAFGSCLGQREPQPIWKAVVEAAPQLFLMIGDNVYGDVSGPDMAELTQAYRDQLANPDFAAARVKLPFLATWDDHDYGANDAGGDFAYRTQSEALFRDFWQRPAEPGHASGLYTSRSFGPPGARVEIILLDTRSFRSRLREKTSAFPFVGSYEPDPDPARTMLGAEQWAWLEAELRKPADIRIVASSVQVLGEGHGFERWGNFPAERERLVRLIEETGARGVILVSGDRHIGALYGRKIAGGQTLVDLTSSSLNRSRKRVGDTRTPEVMSDFVAVDNFGLIEIEWEKAQVRLSLVDVQGARLADRSFAFSELGLSR
jgi:alkaline phosphatase D